MNEQTTTDLETDNLTNKIKNDSYRTEVLELIRLCNVSRMPEKIGEFIEQDVNAKQAQEILMSILAERTKKTEILSTIPQPQVQTLRKETQAQDSSEDLIMQVAKARQNSQL